MIKDSKSLIVSQEQVQVDPSVLELIANKKGNHERKDGSICEYFVMNTATLFSQTLTGHHVRCNELMKMGAAHGYNYIVVIIK